MTAVMILLVATLLLSLQNYIYKKFWFRKLDLDIRFTQKTAFEGEFASMSETISNRKLLPLPWLNVKFEVSRNLHFLDNTNSVISDYYYRNDLFTVLMYQKIVRKLDFKCAKRGHYAIRSADLVTNNIMFSSKLSRHSTLLDTITVYPRIIDTSELELVARQIQGDIITKRFINPDPFLFKGIREYMPTDPLKNINFLASAQIGSLMVNLREYTVTEEIIIMLNLQDYNIWSSAEVFEESIRLTASLATYFIERSTPVGLISNGRDFITKQDVKLQSGSSGSHLTNIYELLARIDLESERNKMSSMIYENVERGGGNKVFVLISTYHEKDFFEAFEYIRSLNYAVLWIVPAFADLDVKLPNSESILRWEVKPEDVPLQKEAGGERE